MEVIEVILTTMFSTSLIIGMLALFGWLIWKSYDKK